MKRYQNLGEGNPLNETYCKRSSGRPIYIVLKEQQTDFLKSNFVQKDIVKFMVPAKKN